ncbi:hypothetical protein SELMODRAFT_402904 [Selaginella moellendorffii]|uniref:Protein DETOXIFICATION n=1 Tax=Selaginella moellendorffii TaxID=88036 RepID=D8QNE6_SELML|nr:hypothetical protein SELMODRAFT_402904 [Selaginella moellendorffii]
MAPRGAAANAACAADDGRQAHAVRHPDHVRYARRPSRRAPALQRLHRDIAVHGHRLQSLGVEYHKVGLYLYRAVLVLLAVAIPVAVLWLNILLVLHQAPDISSSAGIYARWLVQGLFAFCFLQPLIKFLQAWSFVLLMFLCSSVTLVVHFSICWVLIYKVGMGNAGAALATSVSNWINVFFLAGVALLKCLPELSMEVFEHVFDFLNWQCLLRSCSGVLPNPKLETSVFSIMSVKIFSFLTRISNELGAGHPFEARLSQGVSFGLTVIDAVFVSTLLFCLRDVLGRAFSNEAEVVGHVSRMIPILAAMTVMDAFAGVVSAKQLFCKVLLEGVVGRCLQQLQTWEPFTLLVCL